MLGRGFYCSTHHRPPRIWSLFSAFWLYFDPDYRFAVLHPHPLHDPLLYANTHPPPVHCLKFGLQAPPLTPYHKPHTLYFTSSFIYPSNLPALSLPLPTSTISTSQTSTPPASFFLFLCSLQPVSIQFSPLPPHATFTAPQSSFSIFVVPCHEYRSTGLARL